MINVNDFLKQHSPKVNKSSAYTQYGAMSNDEKIKARINACGKYQSVEISPYTGELKTKTYFCHYWRVCPTCKKIRESKFEGMIEAIVETNDKASAVIMTESDFKKTTRKVAAEDYLRVPMENDMVMLVVGNDFNNEKLAFAGDVVKLTDMDYQQLARDIAVTPPRKRISGSLWIETDDDNDEEGEEPKQETIVITQVAIDADALEVKDIYSKATSELWGNRDRVEHTNIANLQAHITEVEESFAIVAERMGYNVVVICHKKKKIVFDAAKFVWERHQFPQNT